MEHNNNKIYKSSLKKRLWRHSPQGYKSHRLSSWKIKHQIEGDLNILYDIWYEAEKCDYCLKTLQPIYRIKNSMDSRTLDHCHECGFARGILCSFCNLKNKLKCEICNEEEINLNHKKKL